MCGIAGVVDLTAGGVRRDALERMTRLLEHRGPDDEGCVVLGPVGLGHRRLSIIDLGGGHQPMSTEDGTLHIVFNGEIYNFPEVRAELVRLGETFRTRSDTEVILKAYRVWGVDALARLNGMFAFAIWDEPRQLLFAARDRLGKKPFFYHQRSGLLTFASEMKSLLAYPGTERTIDPGAIDLYLTHSYVPSPRTIFTGVRKLPPAHYLTFERGRLTVAPYWELRYGVEGPRQAEDQYVERLEHLFREAVRRRLISDVPIGAFLSGGLDSSAVVGMMAQISDEPVRTFTIGFEEEGFSEVEDARLIAKHFGTRHSEYVVKADAIAVLPELVWYLDEPFGDSSAVPSYYVAKMAREQVKVVLSGDGGDELFGGYTRYIDALRPRPWRWIPGGVRRRVIGTLAELLPINTPGRNRLYEMGHLSNNTPSDRLGIYPYIKDRLYSRAMRGEVSRSRAEPEGSPAVVDPAPMRSLDALSRLQYWDTKSYLPDDILVKVDRTSMAHALETRAPLLDHVLVSYVATIPSDLKLKDGVSKYLFRKMAARYLPAAVFNKKKQGFGIPKDAWFRSDLKGHARERLLDPRSLGRGYFDRAVLERVLEYHAAGQRDYSDWLWSLLVLEEWHRVFIDADTRRV